MKLRLGIGLLMAVAVTAFVIRPVFWNGKSSWAQNGAIKTLTQLPAFPASLELSRLFKSKTEILQEILDVKLTTYPAKPSIAYRIARHRTTGIFSVFEPREDQIKQLAPHYDLFLLIGLRGSLVPIIKQVNPSAKVLMYMANSLTSVATLLDPGSVDAENTDWILKNHPNWLLKGGDGKPIQGTSWSPKYWPDPGNKEWQAFFVQKVNKALKQTGGLWDGVLFDEFLTTHTGHTNAYVGSSPKQVNYATDQAFQQAQLDFLKNVVPGLSVPILPNVDSPVLNPTSPAFNPDFFAEVLRVAGGAEAEVFALHSPDQYGFLEKEMVQVYLDRARNTPPGKMLILSSPTAALEGNVERTLYAYFTYLLVAAPGRGVYWAFKEGESSVPHFWFKEFDLDLGLPLGEMQSIGQVWTRNFANTTVVVNPNPTATSFAFKESYFDVLGGPVNSPVSLGPNSGVLLMKSKGTIPKAPLLHEVK